MAGYVIVIALDQHIPKLKSLFAEAETSVVSISDQRSIIYVSNDGVVEDGNFFRGFAIDHEHKKSVYPGAKSAELPLPEAPVDGSYLSCLRQGKEINIGADNCGFTSMLWFTDDAVSAVSDSFLALLHVRRSLGLVVTPDTEAIKGRMWRNAMANQQLSQSTFCGEIKYSTPGSKLSIDSDSGIMTEHVRNLIEYYKADSRGHPEAVRESAIRMIQSFKCYASTGGLVSLGLSGGIDSRACLAAGLASDIGGSLLIGSSPKAVKDFPIAQKVANQLNFELNSRNKLSLGKLKQNDQLALWAATSLGIYDPPYSNGYFRQLEVPMFSVGGHGAGAAKGGFGWRRLDEIAMPPATLKQARQGVQPYGVDPADEWGSEWHFLAYRNAIHGGRGALQSDYVARPVSQTPLIGLSRSSRNQLERPIRGRSVIMDTMIIINPDLAILP